MTNLYSFLKGLILFIPLGAFFFLWSAYPTSASLKGRPKLKVHPFHGLNIYQLLTVQGYEYENHTIETEDGYILEMQRVPHGKSVDAATKGPILLMPGMMSSSTSFIIHSKNESLGLLMAEAGFDVWLGNPRGNVFGRKHKTLDPDQDKEFWDFSWHEIGYYDVPAMIDYILKTTNEEQLEYLGYSQGGTVFFTMASERPEYLKKIKFMTALAPGVYFRHLKNHLLKAIAPLHKKIWDGLSTLSTYEFFRHSDKITELAKDMCSEGSSSQEICVEMIFRTAGYSPYQMDAYFLPASISNEPSGGSLKQIVHFAQLIDNEGIFRKFDYYDEMINIEKYGDPKPPKYQIDHIDIPIASYCSSNDLLVADEDCAALSNDLPNVVVSKLIPDKYFNHMDFAFAKDAKALLFDEIIENMLKYSDKK